MDETSADTQAERIKAWEIRNGCSIDFGREEVELDRAYAAGEINSTSTRAEIMRVLDRRMARYATRS